MKENEHIKKEPFFHIVKRDSLTPKKKVLLYALTIFLGLLVGGFICSLLSKKNTIDFFVFLFEGSLGSSRRIWVLLQDTALLLGVSLALVPAFKMKFWNLGGNGQILMGCLAYVACMFYLGGKVSDIVVVLLGLISGVLAGAIWALIPAIFKAFFDTNESLFTLMMNYIASGLIWMFLTIWLKNGETMLRPIEKGNIPELGNKYLLPIIIFFLLAVAMYVYLKYSKQGYEISVVGESTKTARYIGINVKKVIIRTLVLSGAIAGLVGAVLGGAIEHTVAADTAKNMGFTAIMTAWLANFNPLVMIASCFFISFISKGMVKVRSEFGFTSGAISNIVVGVVYFAVISVSFFITYRVVFRDGAFDGVKKLWERFKKLFRKDNKENKQEEGDA